VLRSIPGRGSEHQPVRSTVKSRQRAEVLDAAVNDVCWMNGVQLLFALSNAPPEVSIALKGFFALVELLIIGAGVYVFRSREKLFGYRGKEGDTYASANLRLAMVVLIWIHSVIIAAIMIFEV